MPKAGVTIDRIVAELAKIAFSDIRKALDWGMKQTEEGPVQYVTLKDSQDVAAGQFVQRVLQLSRAADGVSADDRRVLQRPSRGPLLE